MKAQRSRYISTPSLTSVLDGGGLSTPLPSRFTPWKETQHPFYRRLGGPKGRCGRVWKTSPSPGLDPRTVQPVASRYTDYAIPAHFLHIVRNLRMQGAIPLSPICLRRMVLNETQGNLLVHFGPYLTLTITLNVHC